MRRILLLLPLVLALGCASDAPELPHHANRREIAWAQQRFEEAGSPASFSFVVLGDNRDGDAVHEELLRMINADPDVLFVLNVGDIVRDGQPYQFRAFVQQIASARVPYIVIPGNHDSKKGGRELFVEIFGPRDFMFEIGDCRFVCLDNAGRKLTDDQLDWLRKKLDTPRRLFVFLHVPPPVGTWAKHSFEKGALEFLEICHDRGVKRIYAGHIHGFGAQEFEGIPMVVSGGAGSPMDGHRDLGVENVFHYVKVSVSPGGITDTRVELPVSR